jgi:putative cell wall-binding protein/beta-lactamase class A
MLEETIMVNTPIPVEGARRGGRRSRTVASWVVATLVVTMAAVLPAAPDPAVAAPTTSRIGGENRYAVSAQVSATSFPDGAATVYVTSGETFPDALSAAPAAASEDAPLLLTAPSALPSVIEAEVARLAPERIVIVGGTASVSPAVEERLATTGAVVSRVTGAQRYEVSRALVADTFDSAELVYVATGEKYADALAAAAAAGAQGAPVLLIPGWGPGVDEETFDLLDSLQTSRVLIAGGTASVNGVIGDELRAHGLTVTRLQGADRFSASVAIAQSAFPRANGAFLTNGLGFADGLTGAGLAARTGSPLYLAQPTCVPDGVRSDIVNRLGATTVTLLGGPVSLNADVATLTDCSTLRARQKASSEKALFDKILARLASAPGSYAVTVRMLDGLGETVGQVGAQQKEPASSIKLFAAYAALKRVDEGSLSVSQRLSSGVALGDCLRFMIHVSDNYCHTDIIRLLGNDNINALLAREGYSGTHYVGNVNGQYFSSKTSTSDDLTLLVSRLERGEILSVGSRQYLLDLMKNQIWRSRIASGLPPGVTQASKPGELWVSSGITQIDTAIVYSPAGRYTIAVLGSNGATKDTIASISRIVYEHFNGPFGAAASYPVQQLYAKIPTTLRSGVNGSVIASVPAGSLVEAVTSVRDWYHVVVNGRTGYIDSTHLANRY